MVDTRPISHSYHYKLDRLKMSFSRGHLPRLMIAPPVVTPGPTPLPE
ncbi:hypothetical protein N7E02_23375 [Aliirhizobium terrae]|nr:hypothetical protein [Rhizobium sp. CC-CFT758]WJH39674.1 hypothetical protein N7E02_23375 [Rhizobium sp. CC-CFT758]